MSQYSSLFLLFTTVSLTTATDPPAPSPLLLSPPSTSPPPPPPPISTLPPPPPPPPPRPEYMQQQQLKNIIDALIGAGDFAGWANILFNPTPNSSIPTNPALIPTTATMFVPGNAALSRLSNAATGAYTFDPFIIPYHVLPQRLTFSDLQLFKTLTRLPTLLPSKTILITNNSPSNFTIDDSLITEPDIYTNDAVCVHGIASLLDYTVYGAEGITPPEFLPPPPLPPLPPADDSPFTPPPEVVSSTSGGCCVGFLISSVLINCAIRVLLDFV